MADPFDEDADVRSHLAVLGRAALADLRRILEAPSTDRTSVLRALMARPTAADLATLIAISWKSAPSGLVNVATGSRRVLSEVLSVSATTKYVGRSS